METVNSVVNSPNRLPAPGQICTTPKKSPGKICNTLHAGDLVAIGATNQGKVDAELRTNDAGEILSIELTPRGGEDAQLRLTSIDLDLNEVSES